MNDWQVESFRLTVFRFAPIHQVEPLWENFTGEKPAKVDSQPRDNIIREEGPIPLGTLVHFSNPIRIDWVLAPSQEQQKVTTLPVLGSFTEVGEPFVELISRWLTSEQVPEIKRIALGFLCLLASDSKEAAYKQLSTFLPHIELDIENSSDFLYQINRPIKSRIEPDLVINRLSKWSATRTTEVGLILSGKPELFTDNRRDFACRLELDINTSRDYAKEISKEKLVEIFRELNKLGEEIASNGDR